MICVHTPKDEDLPTPGHWGGDLPIGAREDSDIPSLVEASTGYVLLVKLDSRQDEHVAQRHTRRLPNLPTERCLTLTLDRGHEMAEHHAVAVATDLSLCFSDTKRPWPRKIDTHANGLPR